MQGINLRKKAITKITCPKIIKLIQFCILFAELIKDIDEVVILLNGQEGYSLEELQEMLFEMVTGYDSNLHFPRKKTRTS